MIDFTCAGAAQLSEKDCRHYVPTSGDGLCGGAVSARLVYGAYPLLGDDALDTWRGLDGSADVVVWGVGAHPTRNDYETRAGVNNATDFARFAVAPVCDASPPPFAFLPQSRGVAPRVLWLGQHCRVRWKWEDETNARITDFARDAAAALRARCRVETLDTAEATCALVNQRPDDAANMTFDGVHWGLAVNLLKAVKLLHVIGAGWPAVLPPTH